MAEKRKMSTRSGGEPIPKKRALTPLPPPPPPVEPIEEGLPTRLKEGQDLPTLPMQQEKFLPDSQYQSIAESGVLATSIERSRQTWLAEGLFERYWAKPSKKKASVEIQNPAKESMTRLGVCSMIIEPHVFETTLYVVKEPQPVFATPQSQAQPLQPDMRYNSFSHVAIYPPAPRGIEYPHTYTQQQHNLPQPKSTPFKAELGHFGTRESPLYHKSPPMQSTNSMSLGSQDVLGRSSTRDEAFQAQEDKSSSDPVIQMLATRAASNPNLKALMKVVASGEATPTELKDFQFHIDELNNTLKTRNKHSQDVRGQTLTSIPPFIERASTNQPRISSPALNIGQVTRTLPMPGAEPFKQELLPPILPQYAQHPKNKSLTPYKSDIAGVVFDVGGVGDRYSFPKLSILEYLPGGTQVIVSFLIIRKGNEAASKGYKDTVTYYQPVTMRLSSLQPRTLEPLARIVASPDEVRNYMDNIFETMTRADNLFLATRLPRTAQGSAEKDDSSAPLGQALVQTLYSPPHTLGPRAA